MTSTLNKAAGIVGLALIVAYSVIMMTTSGTAGDWAWLVLVAGIALLVKPATAAIDSGSQSDG